MDGPATLAEMREAYVSSLAEALKDVVAKLAAKPEVERAILFGSYAAGRRDLLTDLDILIIVHSEDDFVTRTADMYAELHSPVDMDLLVYTPEELERQKERGFIRRALAEGTVIYEKSAA